jgi:hypothetical protein
MAGTGYSLNFPMFPSRLPILYLPHKASHVAVLGISTILLIPGSGRAVIRKSHF